MSVPHTPGPWEYDGDYIWAPAIEGYVADPQTEDMRSGNVVPLRDAQATIDANARLIAVAPQLAEACRAVARNYQHDAEMPTFARKCIAALTAAGVTP